MMKLIQNNQIYRAKAYGVREYAIEDEINIPFRQAMEDYCFVHDNILQDGSQSILFGVLDGHGGKSVAEFIQKNFHLVFIKNYKNLSSNIEQLLTQTFLQVNELCKISCNSQETGSTASIGFIRIEQAKRILYMANVGDSRAVLCDDRTVQFITQDHKIENKDEKDRIIKSQGIVFGDRVGGVLAVTRAFGDHSLTGQGVIANPYINRIQLRLIHKWVIVASDGLWDVVNEKSVLDVLKQKTSADEVAKSLVQMAIKLQTLDNVSVICLKLN